MGSDRRINQDQETAKVQKIVKQIIDETGVQPKELYKVYKEFLRLCAEEAPLEEIKTGVCNKFDRNVIDYLAITGLYFLVMRVSDEMDKIHKR